jgi:hypothetical protein
MKIMHNQFFVALFLTVFFFTLSASADTPTEVWQYEALSNLYAPPLVADVAGTPEMEIIISDSESRRVRCIDATAAGRSG